MVTELVGTSFGNFKAVRLLGEGGFGAVYLAEHPLVDRRAAIKVLHANLLHTQELVARFFNEARAASAIKHQNIVEVFDAGTTAQGLPYITMEYLDGESLKARIERLGRINVATTMALIKQAASALTAAHTQGIVHRDLKPENLFLVPTGKTADGEGDQLKILDFGIAKLTRQPGSMSVKTEIGQFMGSPPYMSPEQWVGARDLDHRTDIYALAVIIYEMLTGSPPFLAESVFDMREMHLRISPASMRIRMPGIPEHIDAAVMRGLSKRQDERFPDVTSFMAALSAGPSQTLIGSDEARAPTTARGAWGSVPPTATTALPLTEAEMGNPPGELASSRRGAQAQKTRTTFSNSNGEIATTATETARGPKRRGLLVPLIVGGAVAAGGIAFLLLRPSGHGPVDPGPRAEAVRPEAPTQPALIAPVHPEPPATTRDGTNPHPVHEAIAAPETDTSARAGHKHAGDDNHGTIAEPSHAQTAAKSGEGARAKTGEGGHASKTRDTTRAATPIDSGHAAVKPTSEHASAAKPAGPDTIPAASAPSKTPEAPTPAAPKPNPEDKWKNTKLF